MILAATLEQHQLLLFWIQLALLLGTARGLANLAKRFGQPPVVGELGAGLVVGPTLLGRVAPGLFDYLFPAEAVQQGLLLAVSWLRWCSCWSSPGSRRT